MAAPNPKKLDQQTVGLFHKVPVMEISSALKALSAGIPPGSIEALLPIWVGRNNVLKAISHDAGLLAKGQKGVMRIVQGNIGSGKTFMLTISAYFVKEKGGIVSKIDLNNKSGFSSKASVLEMLAQLIYGFSSSKSAGLGALMHEIRQKLKDGNLLNREALYSLFEPLDAIPKGVDFRSVLCTYFTSDDSDKKDLALKWLTLEAKSKSELKRVLKIDQTFSDSDFATVISLWSSFFKLVGFKGGTLIILDELAESYSSLSTKKVEICNNFIFSLYNEIFAGSGRTKGVGLYIGATREVVEHQKHGLYAHDALRSRIKEAASLVERENASLQSSPIVPLSEISQEALVLIGVRVVLLYLLNCGKITPESITTEVDRPVIEFVLGFVRSLEGEGASIREFIKRLIDALDQAHSSPDDGLTDWHLK